MKKFIFFLGLILCDNAMGISSGSLVSCTVATAQTDCANYATYYCGGGSVACGTVVLGGTTYTNKCYCQSCGSGLVTGGAQAPHCICSDCTKTITTNATTNLMTISYTSKNTLYCFEKVTDSSPMSHSSICAKKTKSYACASGYGSATEEVGSDTVCWDCDGKLHSDDFGASFSTYNSYSPCALLNNGAALLGVAGAKYYKAWLMEDITSTNPSAPSSKGSACGSGSCIGNTSCYYRSTVTMRPTSTSTNCYGVILYGCPVEYGGASCDTSQTGCANSVHNKSTASCVCAAGYYGTAPNACSSCPTHSTGKQTSAAGSDAETDCFLPTNTTNITGDNGKYKATTACYYTE